MATFVGSFEFTMDGAAAASVVDAFEDPAKRAAVSAAFAISLSNTIDGIEVEDIIIRSITTSHPLRGRRLRNRGTQRVQLVVDYVIRTEVSDDPRSSSFSPAVVENIDTAAMVARVTAELQTVEGLDEVVVDWMEPPVAPIYAPLGTIEAPTPATASEAPLGTTEAPTTTTTFVLIAEVMFHVLFLAIVSSVLVRMVGWISSTSLKEPLE